MFSAYPISFGSNIQYKDDVAEKILPSLEKYFPLKKNDVLVVDSKIISHVQGNLIEFKNEEEKDKIIKEQAKRILRKSDSGLISETSHGFILEDAGIIEDGNYLITLPLDVDKAANSLRLTLLNMTGFDVPFVISTNAYRPFRNFKVQIAIGISGLATESSFPDSIANLNKVLDSEMVLVRDIDKKYLGNGRAKDLITSAQDELFS